jgi:hypothetical protein
MYEMDTKNIIIMEDDTDMEKLKKSLSQCHFVHHKSHMDCPGHQR